MKLLLDTQVWLWMQVSPERIDDKVRELIADPANELLLSAASAWEIAIKYALGKIPLPTEPADYVMSRMSRSGTAGLPVQHSHVPAVTTLPPLHRDPFDRLLISQSLIEQATLVTADTQITQYDVDLLKA